MKKMHLLKRLLAWICLGILLFALPSPPARAYEASTLHNGSRGDDVRELQQALIDLGYLNGTADGVFGTRTENAVRAFQKKNRLDVDGLAGIKTRELILSKAQGKNTKTAAASKTSQAPAATAAPASAAKASSSSSGSLFGGNYATIRFGNRGDRVKALQNALISVGSLKGKADGIFGTQTYNAVKSFQRSKKLTADGIAGKQTLSALEKASGNGSTASAAKATATPQPVSTPQPSAGSGDINDRITAPSASSLRLLHWFNDVKPTLSGGKKLLIYDPSSGLCWTLRILSCGRHCDAEPLTAKDTRTMVKAFGGTNTWSQKAVFVKLPSGVWTIGSTHDMPHDSGSIKDNDFNGHLCVHFLRDMDEAKKNDPKYGVSNQETIRTYWKKWTGQEITD